MPGLTPKFVNINGKYIRIRQDGLPNIKDLGESDKGFVYVTEINGEKKVYMLKISKTQRILRWAPMTKKNIDSNDFRTLRPRSIKSMIPPKIESEDSSTKELEKFRKELQSLLQNKESTNTKSESESSNVPLIDLNF